MQAARDEMVQRIETLERRVKHCDGERQDLLLDLAKIDQQIEQDKQLAADYQEVLRRLTVTITYADIVSDGQGRPDAL